MNIDKNKIIKVDINFFFFFFFFFFFVVVVCLCCYFTFYTVKQLLSCLKPQKPNT